ncbi:SLAP domain-containing protein [Lactobacillus sp. ESL0785]|uniref:SLAP domain-containing protein n=1 Tax=Lactobacillus sp. ESL0785 TaxID=2983232 RepID=UPI0023F8DEE1|nr:SLAP domain-containing protein [Lactobacillus sp. ESL0785]WEV70361.1 SLAP domain-containing protein [Lactobacillus sp. ESL0785]
MELQDKQDRFSIRKLSIGAASVLLGFTFFNAGTQSVQADTVDSAAQVKQVEQNTSAADSNASQAGSTAANAEQNSAATTPKKQKVATAQPEAKPAAKKEPKIDTYDKLSKFLRGSDPETANTAAKPDTAKKPTTSAKPDTATATAAQTPAVSTSNDVGTDNNTSTTSAAANKPGASDITSGNATDVKPVQKPETSTGDNAVAVNNEGSNQKREAEQVATSQSSDGLPLLTTHDHIAYVSSWSDLMQVFRNTNITKVYLTQDIADDEQGSVWGNDWWGSGVGAHYGTGDRYVADRVGGLTITSNPTSGKRFKIDFKGLQPRPEKASRFSAQFAAGDGDGTNGTDGRMFLTYDNVDLWSESYYGVAETEGVATTVTFNNINFHGTQMLYLGADVEVHFKGTDIADVIRTPYVGPVDGDTNEVTPDPTTQQLFQFTGANSKLFFDEGCTFTGSTYQGNVIEMSGPNSSVFVGKNATVTLNPTGNADSRATANGSENTGKSNGIIINGSGNNTVTVAQGGKLIINVGGKDEATRNSYRGGYDYHQAAAITLISDKSQIINNGIIDVNTNGDISTNWTSGAAKTLIYDNGNLKVNQGAELNITGTNMQDYSGTLVSITRNAYLENAAFNIKLVDPSGKDIKGATTGGTGTITLVDVTGNLVVNNPTKLTLDDHLNDDPSHKTSIIGDHPITIQNVRQNLNLGGSLISLPPFHKLVVHHTNPDGLHNLILVDNIELLNGKRKLTPELAEALKKNPQISAMLGAIASQLDSLVGKTFDEIFAGIIEAAFMDPNSPGYNDIAFVSANQEGFLNIDNAKVITQPEDDGSRIVTGSIENYTDQLDGPNSDGLFGKILPGGTYAYITASIVHKDNAGNWVPKKNWTDPTLTDDPYGMTDLCTMDTDLSDLSNHIIKGTHPQNPNGDPSLPQKMTFAAKVNPDGTFSFTLPAEFTSGLEKGDAIELTPTANFIGYDPEVKPTVLDLNILNVTDVQAAADAAINKAANDAIAKVKADAEADPDQTPEHQRNYQTYEAAINAIKNNALRNPTTASDTDSIYNPNSSTADINKAKQAALDKFNNMVTMAAKTYASSDTQYYLQAAKKDLKDAGIPDSVIPTAATLPLIHAITAAATPDAATMADTTAKKSILNDYQTAVQNALKNYDSPAKTDLNKLNLSSEQSSICNSAITSASDLDVIDKLGYVGDGTEFNNSAAIIAAHKQVDTAYRKARALSALRNYCDTIGTAYPNAKDQIIAASAAQEKVIQNETNDSNLQDSKTGADATDDNRANVPDDQVGITAIDNAVKAYKKGLKDNINEQQSKLNDELDTVKKLLNNHGLGDDPDIANDFKGLQDELAEAAAIAKDQDQVTNGDPADAAAIDKGQDGKTTEQAHQTAQDLLDDVQHRLDALKDLENYATNKANANSGSKPNIDKVLASASKDIFKAPKDTTGKTPIEDAAQKGKDTIDRIVEDTPANDDIQKAAEEAHNQVNNANIPQIQKDAYNKAIDDAKNAALNPTPDKDDTSSIYGSDNPEDINNRKNRAINKIKKAAAKAAINGYAQDAKDIVAGDTAAIDAAANDATADQTGTIDKISDGGLSANDNSAKIAQAEEKAKENILAAAQHSADKQLADKEKEVEDALGKLSTLTGDELAAAKQKAQGLIHSSDKTGSQDKVDAAKDLTGVGAALNDGIDALNNFLIDAVNKDRKQQAINDVEQKRQDVINDLNDKTKYPNLTDQERQDLITSANNTAKQDEGTILNGADDAVDTNKTTAIDHLNDIIANANTVNNTHTNELKVARQTALGALAVAKQQAEKRVNAYDDTAVDQSKKTAIINKIEADYKAAVNAINGATNQDAVSSAEETGANNMNADADEADLEAKKSQAINALQQKRDTDKAIVDQAAKDGKITPDQQKSMDDQIDNYYLDGAKNINNAKNQDEITSAQNTAGKQMDGVVATIDNTTLDNDRDQANNDLDTLAGKAKKHIDDLSNLGSDEKAKLKGDVDKELAAAHTAVNGAKTPKDITSASAIGQNNIQDVANTADLEDAQNAAKNKLDQEKSKVDQALDGLQNIDSDSLAALKQDVQNAYDDALGKINNPTPATTDQVGKEAQTGCDNMDQVLENAQGLDQTKTNDKTALDQAAKDANARIDQSDLNDQEKQNAHQAINQARDAAKNRVDAAGTIADANNQRDYGKQAITDAEADARKQYLNDLKDQANKKIDKICNDAQTALTNEFNSLDDDEQAEVKPKFDQAKQDIEDARSKGHTSVNNAKNSADITGATNQANTDVTNAKKPAFLASSQAKGKKELQEYADKIKNQLPVNGGYRDQVDELLTSGKEEITNDQTPSDVTNTVTVYKGKLDGIQNTASSDHNKEINTAKQDAINALDHTLNGDSTTGAAGAVDDIQDLGDLSDTEKAKYEQQAKDAHDKYVNSVTGDDNVTAINSDRDTGIAEINKAVEDAKLQNAKNAANKQIEQARQDAVDKINSDSTLTDQQKQDAINSINSAASEKYNGGKYQVNQAKDKDSINSIVNNTKNHFNDIVSTAKNNALQQAKTDAKNRLEANAKQRTDRITADKLAGKLSSTQADALIGAVTHDLAGAEDAVDNATTQAGVATAESNGNLAFALDDAEINKDEVQKADLDKVAAAVTTANQKAADYIKNHPTLTEQQKKHLYDQINSISNDTTNEINQHRTDKSDAISNMEEAAQAGIDKLGKLTDKWDEKETAVEKLKQHAKDVEDKVNKDNPDYATLTPAEIAAAQAAADQVEHDGENDILGLDMTNHDPSMTDQEYLNQTEQKWETAIDNALLPSKLLNDKNKQTSKLNDYAVDKDKDLDALAQNKDNPNGLTSDEISAYKKQIEQARQAAANNILGEKLPADATTDDYNTGKSQVGDDETAGEKAIDQIINNAKLASNKRQDIADIQNTADEAEKQDGVDSTAVDKLVNQAEQDIAGATDTAGPNSPDGIKENTENKIQDLVDQAKSNQYGNDIDRDLLEQEREAEAIIDRSQLTDQQKQDAKAKLQALYADAAKMLADAHKDPLYPDKDPNNNNHHNPNVPADIYAHQADIIKQGYEKEVAQVLEENTDSTNFPWFGNEVDNAHGDLNNKWQDLEGNLSPEQKAKYADLIDTVNNSIAKLDKSKDGHNSSIKDATDTYDAGLTALNKLKAIKEVEDAENAANNAIDGTDGLTDQQKQDYKERVKQNADKTIANINKIIPTDNDTIGNQDKIDTAKKNNIADIAAAADSANAGAIADARQNAKNKIDAAYNAAKEKLGDAYTPDGELDQAYKHELDKLSGLSYDALQDSTAAIKNIDKAAVNEAATYAKNKISNLQHSANKPYSNEEKNVLNNVIANDVTAANGDQGTITNGTVDPDDTVSGARDAAIDKILADATGTSDADKEAIKNDPACQLADAKEQAEKDLATIYQAAKEKLPMGADSSKLDDAFNNNKVVIGSTPDEIKHNAEKAQQAIAKGAVQAAAEAAKNKINGLTHYTDDEKEALKNQIDKDVTAANEAIDNSTKDKDSISKDDAEKATNDGSVSGTLNDQLATIAADSEGTSSNDNNALNNDSVLVNDAKEQAKKDVSAAGIAANEAVDQLKTHQNGQPYTDAEKQAIKDAIQQEVDKANKADTGTIDQAGNVAEVNQAKQDAINAINKIKDACTSNDGSILDPITNGNSAVQQEQKAKQAAKDAVTAAADKARQDLGVDKGSSEAAAIDKAEQDALNSLEQVKDGKYDTAENNGLANVVSAEKDTGKQQLEAEETAAEGAINQTPGLSQSDKDKAISEAQQKLNSAKEAIDKLNSADTNSENVGNKQDAIKDAYNAGKAGISGATSSADSLSKAKEQAKKDVSAAGIAANEAVDQLKTHQNGQPYTDAEKQAIKDAIQQEVDKANKADTGTIDQAGNVAEVNQAKQDAINAINKIKDACTSNDGSILDPITNGNSAVQQEQKAKQAAKDAVTAAADKARQDLGVDKGSSEAAAIDKAEQDALNSLEQVKDGKYDTAENNGLANVVSAEKDTGKQQLEAEETAAEGAINQTPGLSQSDKDKAISEAQQKLNSAKEAIDKLNSADTNSENVGNKQDAIKDAYNAGKAGISGATSSADSLSKAKEQAKKDVSAAGIAANEAVDQLKTHQNGQPYTDAEKQAIKDAIQQEVDKANKADTGTIDQAGNVAEVNQAKQDAINAINKIKDACTSNDGSILDPITNGNSAVQQEQKAKQAAKDAVTAAADKARQDLGVDKGSSEAAAIDKAEQDALNSLEQVKDGKYDTAENNGLANVVSAEKDTGKQQLEAEETAAEGAINQTPGLSQSDKDKAISEAQQKLNSAKEAIDKLNSADTNSENVGNKQDAIKDAYNAGKAGISGATSSADSLSKAKEQAKKDVSAAGIAANEAVDQLKTHQNGQPYTDAEKQAIKDAIQQEVDKANKADTGTIDQAGNVAEVNQAKQDAINAINKIKDACTSNDGSILDPITNGNSAVQQEQKAKQAAKDAVTAAADKARQDLGVDKGSSEAAAIDKAEQDALNSLEQVKDGKYDTAENNGLANVVSAEKDTGKQQLEAEETAAEGAINQTPGLSQSDKDKAISEAQQKLNSAKEAIDKLNSADTNSENVGNKQDAIKDAYNAGKAGISGATSSADSLSKAKEQAKKDVSAAGIAANEAVDQLKTHQNGQPYTDAEKQAIKDAIQQEVDKANKADTGTIDQAGNVAEVNQAKQDAINAINKIKDACTSNDGSILDPITNGNSAVQQEQKAKQAAKDAVTAAADKARQDLGVDKGSSEAAAIDKAEQDALNSLEQVKDGKYDTAENNGLANVVSAEKDTGKQQLEAEETAAEGAINQTPGLSQSDKDKAISEAQQKLNSAKEAIDKLNSADTNSENVGNKQDAIKDAYNAGKAGISGATSSADSLSKAKEQAKKDVSAAGIAANEAVDQLKTHQNGQPYTDAEKQAIKDAIQQEVDKANKADTGTIDQAGNVAEVNQAKQDAINAINKIKDACTSNDGSILDPITNGNSAVQQEQKAKQAAKDAVTAAADKARQDLGVDKGSSEAAAIDKAEQDALNSLEQVKDGKYDTAENNGLANVVSAEKDTGKQQLEAEETAAEGAINQTPGLSQSDKDKAISEAQQKLNSAKEAIDKLNSADTNSENVGNKQDAIKDAYNAGKAGISGATSSADSLSKAKEQAKKDVSAAGIAANEAVDQLKTHQNGQPYTDAEKQAIKDAIQQEVDKANKADTGTIDQAGNVAEVNQAKQDAINAINKIKDACTSNDGSILDPITNGNSAVQQEQKAKQAAKDAVTAAADKARQDLGVDKGSSEAAAIDKAEQDALNSLEQVKDGKYDTAENNGLANVVSAEKDTGKQQLEAEETAAEGAINQTPGLSQSDKDKAISEAQQKLNSAKEAIDKLNSADTNSENVGNKQDAIKDAYNAGKAGISGATSSADSLSKAKEQAKKDVSAAGIAANEAVDQLKTHQNGQPYTDAEKQAIKDAIQQEVDKANKADTGTIDQAGNVAEVNQAKQDAINAINKIKDACTSNDGSILDPITNGNSAVQQEQKAKQAAKDAVTAAADKARQDLGVDKGSSEAAAIDKAEQDALNSLEQVKDGKYDTAENNGLANVVSAEKDTGKQQLEAEETAAEGAINQTPGLSQSDKDKAISEAQQKLNSAKEAIDKLNSADTNSENVGNKQDAIKDAYNAGKAGISGATSSADSLSKAKEQAKKDVSAAGIAANEAVDQLKTHQNGQPYTDAEKQAIKDAIQQEVDKANKADTGTIDQAGNVAEVNQAKQDAINAINKIKDACTSNDGSILDPITNGNSAVQQEQKAKQAAKDAVTAAADKARQDLGVDKGSSEAAAIDKAEQDALNSLEQVKDGKYDTAENNGLANVVSAEKDTGKQQLEAEETAAEGAINQTPGLSQSDKDKAISEAQQKLNSAKEAIDKLNSADTNSENVGNKQDAIKDAYNAGKAGISGATSSADSLSKAKEQAKKDVSAAGIAANEAVDQLKTHQNGQPYTDAEKQAIKDAIQQEVDKANKADTGTIDQAGNVAEVNQAKQDAINAINKIKDACTSNDGSILDPITNGNSAVQQEQKAKQAAKDAVTAAADKARQDLGVDKGSSEAAAIDKAEQDALNSLEQVKDGKYDTAENNGLANVVSAEKDTGKQQLEAEETAAEGAINQTPGLSQSDKDKAISEAQQKLNSAKEAIDKLNSADTNSENVGNKQDAIKDAYNAGKAGISGATSSADSLSKAKEQAKKDITNEAANAKDKINHLNCSDEAKQHLKDEVDKLVATANGSKDNKGTIDQATDKPGVDTAKNTALNDLTEITSPEHVAKVADAYPISNSAPVSSTPATPAPGEKTPDEETTTNVTLKHNAYLYNAEGKRTNKVVLKAGSVVATHGTTTINGSKYYIIQNGKYYIAVENVISTQRKLKHNAYVYNKYGERTNKRLLKIGRVIRTYGSTVSIHGKSYYIIGKNQFIKAANTAGKHKASPAGLGTAITVPENAVTKRIMHHAYLYNEQGQRANGIILKAGSIINTFGTKVIKGKKYLVVADNYYIALGNVIGKRVKLKHNAYTYNQYGKRVGKKVTKKNHKITIYGERISIHGKKFYIVGKNREVKKNNIK